MIEQRTSVRHMAVAVALALTGAMGFGALASGSEDDLAAMIRRHVEYLASDQLEGRLTGSEGAARAADYIVAELGRIGARPLPGEDDFRLPFEFTSGVSDGGSALSVAGGRSWADAAHIQALTFSDHAGVAGAAVFAGYGLVVPPSQGYPYDSYGTLEVKGKIVVVLRYFPEDVDQEAGAVLSRYAGLRYKAMQARERGAAGILVFTGPRSPNAGEVVSMAFDTAVAGSGITAASISGEVAGALFGVSGRDLEAVQAELDSGNPHATGFDLGVSLELDVKLYRKRATGYNIVGYLPASVSSTGLAKRWVMLGAHFDHLGRGGNGNSLARWDEAGQIHNGADDNASGVAAVLGAAARLAGMERGRDVALAFWSGEELGLLGASAFVRQQPIAMDQLAAYVNFDMVGRSRDNKLTLQAVGSSTSWPRLIERSNVPVGFDILIQEDPYLPTDSAAFNLVSVPTLQMFTGSHEDYHRPSDDAGLINYEDLDRVAQLGALIVHKVANLEEAPQFVAAAPGAPERGGSRDAARVYTGTIPDYASDIEGLLLGGVIEGGPAAVAGLQAGDVIVELASLTITNIYDYMYALDALKIDEPVKVVFVRDGERHEATLTPRARR